MNKINVLILLLSVALGCSTRGDSKDTYRIMSYNIHHARGMDDVVDVERIGNVINHVKPDVVGLQEVDSVVNRSGNLDILQLLAEQTSMHSVYGYSIWHDGGKYGNGILTRDEPLSVQKIELPGASETRTAQIIELREYVVVNTHLSLNGEERLESVKIITDAVKNIDKPVFLIGDLNATPDSAPMEFLQNDWHILTDPTIPTSPSGNARRTIDYVLGYTANGHIYTVHKAEVLDEQVASDHLPVYVDVGWE